MVVEPKNIIFIDTETTGTDINARIIQVAWVKHGKMIKRLIRPEEPWEMHPKALEAHGITKEYAEENGQACFVVMQELHTAISGSEMLVCHNTAFDKRMIIQEFDRLGLEFPKIAEACTMLGSMDYCNLPGRYGKPKWPTLQELHHKLFGRHFTGAHDAGADISATLQCYFELRKKGIMQ